jgi:hypothetical protein
MNSDTNYESKYNKHEELIRVLLDEIKYIPIAPNPKNTGRIHDEISKYKQIIEIANDKINILEYDIRFINRSNGGKRRKTRKTRSK